MYKVTINNKTYSYEEKRTLESIAQELNIKAYVAKVNNRLRELTFYLNFNCDVEFLDLTNLEAVRAYQTTLRYIISMALKRIDKNAKVVFNDYGYDIYAVNGEIERQLSPQDKIIMHELLKKRLNL